MTLNSERIQTGRWRPKRRPQDVRVGKYFVLSDFLYSEDAITDGVPNRPRSLSGVEVKGMKGLCKHILDPVVDEFGPISITYGLVGEDMAEEYGYKERQLHTFKPPQGGIGGAADIVIHRHRDPRPVLNWIRDNCVYDRLILYPGSRILCVAWTEVKPRYHCKEWLLSEDGGSPRYVNAKRGDGQQQLDLSDRLI